MKLTRIGLLKCRNVKEAVAEKRLGERQRAAK
jgi:hypothetical protein